MSPLLLLIAALTVVVYAWIIIELCVWPGTLTGLLWLCNALLAIKAATGFLRIRKRL